MPAVQRGRNLICSIATLPLVQINTKNQPIDNPLLRQFDVDVPNVVHLAQTLEDLLFDSISWWMITASDFAEFPTAVRHLDVNSVSLTPPSSKGTPAPLPSERDPRNAVVYVDGVETAASRVIRFDSPNPAVLTVGGRAIRRAVLLDAAASMYADDPRPLDYFTPAEGADDVDDGEVQEILAEWKAARKKRSTAWVPRAMKYNSVDAPSPAELQLAELQKQASLDIANALGVDPEDLGISTTSRTYANAVDRRRDRINDVLAPYMRAITDRLTMGDVTRRGHRVVFDLDDFLKANPTERAAVQEKYVSMGVMDPEEVRAEEGLPPGAPKPKPAPAPVPPEPAAQPDEQPADDQQAQASGAPVYQFEDSPGLHFADIPVMSFSVNRETRIVEGMGMPYGIVGEKFGLKFRFLPNSLKWNERNPGRVKLLRQHNMERPLGYAKTLSNTASGLRTRFKVARGTEGDEALQLAEDGVLDGMSVGVDFDLSTDATFNSHDEVWDVHRADLREVSLTPIPVFDDARLTHVAASREEASTMDECAKCGQRHAPNVACPPQPQPANQPSDQQGMALSQDQLTALLTRPGAIQALVGAQQATAQPAQPRNDGGLNLSAEQVDALIRSGQLGVLLGVPQLTPAPAKPVEEQRQTVDPTRRPVAVSATSEPLPYRFDREGNLTKGIQYDFSTDLISGSRGDVEAMGRAQSFLDAMAYRFTSAPFDVDKTDVAGLNPNRNRPDMYVDQKDFTYPIWDAISKGTLADSTPFVLPKFNTASGLVAAHTEGVEPTPGAFTATSQTITPSAVSGKVEITREAWDQGGNPQLSGIIWRQMVKAWFEALEAAAVSLLDGLTPTGITLSTAAQDDVLVGELEAALAALQFVRGGFRFRDLFLQVDLYKALIAASDADGRKLLPRIGPVNANGSVSDFFADLDVGGLRGRPAWALAASGTVAASSYLFDRNDVHGWASAPQRLEFQYRVAYVDVAIWGYKATANTDLTGVREIIYDPA